MGSDAWVVSVRILFDTFCINIGTRLWVFLGHGTLVPSKTIVTIGVLLDAILIKVQAWFVSLLAESVLYPSGIIVTV